MFHQLNCTKIVSLVLLDADSFLLLDCLLYHVQDIITESRASAIIVKNENDATTITDYQV